ncbi:MAG: type VI secretion system tip protein VgrG [Polyangiaceae bacterium]|nr:type VI secretion system tip protein VgrG [Polyangiaceae bacterium]
MATIDLAFESVETSVSVRRFAVREAMSSLFSVEIWARSSDPSLDLGALVGRRATLRVVSGYIHALALSARSWGGVIRYAEQVNGLQPSPGQEGLSTYYFRLVPELWLLTQRHGNRIYQHLSIPEIIDRLLSEWSIKPTWSIHHAGYPRLEFKVQYAESDYAFLCRLLEEAGIAFIFASDGEDGSLLVMTDHPEAAAQRSGSPLPYVENPNQSSEQEYVTQVRLGRDVRPSAVTIRDYDFRNPAFPLFAGASPPDNVEGGGEQFYYDPGSFLVETGKAGYTPVADDRGIARHDLKYGRELARRSISSERVGVHSVSFAANTYDVAPGVVLSIDRHPHADITASRRLLVVESSLEGSVGGEWSLSAYAVFADVPYRPPRQTSKPVVHGLQSATVVGPAGQEIHTDEFGRIRVQFPWDREGESNESSSCWIRVAQGWSGMGYGMITLPRVGQEVLVSFLEGDPDQPVVLGRVYNALQQVPYGLPEHKTRSTWKSDSSTGSGGFNEIMFEDLEGRELVWEHAQKDRQRLVKNDEQSTVGHDRQKLVKNDESERTEGSRLRWVGKDADVVTKQHRRERIEEDCHLEVRGDRSEQVDGKQSLMVVKDRHERVEGRFALKAKKQVHYVAGDDWISDGKSDLTVRGPGGFLRIDESGVTIVGTEVKINVDGSPGKGRGSNPEPPEEPVVEEPVTWVEIVLLTSLEPLQPVPFARYRVELPDGSVREGQLDENGRARIENVAPGVCRVSFPDIDPNDFRHVATSGV